MTLVKRGDVFHYEFLFKGRRYRGSTGQRERDDAELVEAEVKKRARQEVWGIAPVDRMMTPSFTRWAEVYLREHAKRIKRADFVEGCLRTLLQFWGARPKVAAAPKAAVDRPPRGTTPYHDHRLLDPVADPHLIVAFEDWMHARGISGARKNHLRSTLSMMYKLALHPAWRSKTRIAVNPFAGAHRDRVRERTRVLTVDEIRAVMAAAPLHVRVAMSIAVLVPKLRLGNILQLRFDRHLDRALTLITVTEHKADAHARPLVAPIDADLRALLERLRRQNRSKHVVEYQGAPVESIKTALRASVEAAGLVYGTRDPHGVTFHTLRHSIATLLATLPGLSERMRAEVMGQTIPTAQKYTHLAAAHQVGPHRLLAEATGGLWGNLWGGPPENAQNQAQIGTIPRRVGRRSKSAK